MVSSLLSVLCLLLTALSTAAPYTLSLHDALPICDDLLGIGHGGGQWLVDQHRHASSEQRFGLLAMTRTVPGGDDGEQRSEEHTSELQSRGQLVCRLLLEKKK